MSRMQTEADSIGVETLSLTVEEMLVFKETLETILKTSEDFKVRVEAKYLLDMVNRKLTR